MRAKTLGFLLFMLFVMVARTQAKDPVSIKVTAEDPNMMIGFLEAALEENPKDYEVLTQLGMLYGQTGEWETASDYLNKAIALDGQNPTAYGYLGALYNSQQKPEEAMGMLEKSVALGAQDPLVFRTLAGSYFFTQQYDKAIPMIEMLLADGRRDPKAELMLGMCYKNLNDEARALEIFQSVKDFYENSGDHATAKAVEEQYIKGTVE